MGDGTYNNTNRPEQIVAGNVTAIAGGSDHSLFLQSDGSLWAMGYNEYGQLGDGTDNTADLPEQILAANNQISAFSGQLLPTGDMRLSFVGAADAHYALDRCFNLATLNWVPQLTNTTGVLVFTNTPNPATNNFWRIRSVP